MMEEIKIEVDNYFGKKHSPILVKICEDEMECNPLVSIIIPVYGTEEFLSACIDSVCRQTYSNIQIILVDDQSPDKCPEICDMYAKKDGRIVAVHQKNRGVSGARNTGLRYATGQYVLFVDSDDVLYPEAVEILLRDSKEYNADIVSALKRVVDDSGHFIATGEDGTYTVYDGESPLLLSLSGDRNTNSACAKLFRQSFISGIRFEEGMNIQEDGFYLFQCYIRKPKLVQHNIAVYQYNIRQGSGSRQGFSDKFLAMLYFCDKKKELISAQSPQFMEQVYNMEVRTNLQFLDVLCRTDEKKYSSLQRQCVNTVCQLNSYHRPISEHHRKLSWVIIHRLYPLYKWAVRMKYFR